MSAYDNAALMAILREADLQWTAKDEEHLKCLEGLVETGFSLQGFNALLALRMKKMAHDQKQEFGALLKTLSQETFAPLTSMRDFMSFLQRKRSLMVDHLEPLERIFEAFDLKRPPSYEHYRRRWMFQKYLSSLLMRQ